MTTPTAYANIPLVTLFPGDLRITRKPLILKTLLGSCVSLCLYDLSSGWCGMNHYLLPQKRRSGEMSSSEAPSALESGRYGDLSSGALLDGLLRRGVRKNMIRAKAFGGAKLLNVGDQLITQNLDVAQQNVRFVSAFLENERIPVESFDLGGVFGRVIFFNTADFSVLVRKIKKTQIQESFP
jgi:chemotaxis protein CheD